YRIDAALWDPGIGPHGTDRAGPRDSRQGRRAMNPPATSLPSATRPVNPALTAVLRSLKPGQRIQITQTVRVGGQEWQAVVAGTFRNVNYLVTGLATDRVPEDDIVVPMVHFAKDNGELSSVTLDEQSQIQVI